MMSEMNIADRIKKAIIDNGGYQQISDETGISKSTLARTASGQTEPKFKDVIAISRATGVSLNYMAYGMLTEDEEDSAIQEKKMFSLVIDMVRSVSREVEEIRGKLGIQEPKGKLQDQMFSADELKKDLMSQIEATGTFDTSSLQSKEQVDMLMQLLMDESNRRGQNLDTMLEPTQPKKSK